MAALYATMNDFDLFKRLTRLYFAAASFSETARRLGRHDLAPGFLLCDHPAFGPAVRVIADIAMLGPTGRARANLCDEIDRVIEPFDLAGLGDDSRRDWYPVLAEDLVAGRDKLGATRAEIDGLLGTVRLWSSTKLQIADCRLQIENYADFDWMTIRTIVRSAAIVAAMAAAGCNGCRTAPSAPAVSDATYREAVTAFYTGLAAMQTSQDEMARQSLDRVTTLVPSEPAGWANLGLLLLRQQEIEPAMPHLTRAAELAPANGHVQRLLALAEGRRGNLDAAIAHWRKAVSLDPADVKAVYALAQEVERQGGAEHDAEAQTVLEGLVARQDNLVARLDLARLSAKRGDGATLQKTLTPLAATSASWPPEVQGRFNAVAAAASSANPRAAAPAIAFLKNVLLRVPDYRRSLAQVSTPREEVGEPFDRFVTLKNPDPQPAPPDAAIAFAVEPVAGVAGPVGYAGVVVAGEAAPPQVLTADGRHVRIGAAIVGDFPGGARATAPTIRGVASADLNYDYRTDLVLAGDGGLRLLRQQESGAYKDVTSSAKLPASVQRAPLWGVWVADIDTEGDLDLVVSPADGPAVVLRNNGDGSFTAQQPFGEITGVRAFAWLDLDNDLVPDAVCVDAAGAVRVFLNLRAGQFRDASAEQTATRAAVFGFTEAAGRGRFGADLDNNGAIDLMTVTPTTTEIRLEAGPGVTATARTLDMRAGAAADLDGDGRLDLVGIDKDGRGRHREEPRHEDLPLPGRQAEVRDGARRSAHQLVRHRRRSGGSHRPARAAHADRLPHRPHRTGRGHARRGGPCLLAQRHHSVRVRADGRRHHRRDAAPEGLVPVAVCLEWPGDGVCHRPDLAIAAWACASTRRRPPTSRRPRTG